MQQCYDYLRAAVKIAAKPAITLKTSEGIIPSPMVLTTLPPNNKAPKKAKKAPRKRALLILKAPLPMAVPIELPISLAAILKAKYKPKRTLNKRRESIYSIIHYSLYKRGNLKISDQNNITMGLDRRVRGPL